MKPRCNSPVPGRNRTRNLTGNLDPLRTLRVGSAPRIDLACRLRRSWRSSRLPASFGSHQSSLPYSATAWMHDTWTALTLSGRMPYVVLSVWSLASAALSFSIHLLCCSLYVKCASIQTPSQHVACVLNHMTTRPTHIFAVSFGRRCFLWPHVLVNSAASVFAVSNCRPRLLGHWILLAADLSSIQTTWLISLTVAAEPRSSTTDGPSVSDTFSWTHLISSEM